MRCLSLLAAAALAAAPVGFAATPDAVRSDMIARLKEKLPELAPSDYALGAAALDPELRARVQDNTGAAAPVVAAGKVLWTRKFKDGRSLSGCFPNGGRRVAQTYPQYDARLKRVITLEMAVNQCLKAHNEALYDPTEPETMGAVIAYLRSLSDGQKAAVRMPAGADERFEQGRRLYFTRLGQRNYACASCHVRGAGRRFGDVPISPPVGQATHWPVIREGKAVTLQARMRECLELMGAAPFPAGSEELNDLEFFLSYLSNGQPLAANPYRNW